MVASLTEARKLGPATSEVRHPAKEPVLAQIASFVDLFIWLIILKTFFTPIFQIPTGSMAQTLFGEHAVHTCPNCSWEYPIGPERRRLPGGGEQTGLPSRIQCPNCRWMEETTTASGGPLRLIPGDRIIVHGWPYDFGGALGPQRWDVIVFKNPSAPDENYIKRLIGLPGETIELIDGDAFVRRPGEQELRVARKTAVAQESLWMPFHDQDFLPRSTSPGRDHPRWESVNATGWDNLDTRILSFNAPQHEAAIQFVTRGVSESPACVIEDIYGYNPLYPLREVTDVRVGADVQFQQGDGFVEFAISKYQNIFYARLHADGRVTLERAERNSGQREVLGVPVQIARPTPGRAVRFSIGHADYQVVVAVDGKAVITTTPDQYDTNAEMARKRNTRFASPMIRIAAEKTQGTLAHVRVERDVFYRGDPDWSGVPANVSEGHPLVLGNEYFPMGDNSPASLDGRYWRSESVGPHLLAARDKGQYTIGTVPADQMIGKAFLVYFPGMNPIELLGKGFYFQIGSVQIGLPDFGHVRWIH